MDFLLLILRLIHIFSAVVWVGGGFFVLTVLSPTVAEAGPVGPQFMQRLSASGRVGRLFALTSILTTLSGALLYGPASGMLNMNWIMSPYGLTLTIGAVFGILAFLHGAFGAGPVTSRMGALAKEMAGLQGPPPPEKLQEAQSLAAKLNRHSAISVTLASIALLGMSAAQRIAL